MANKKNVINFTCTGRGTSEEIIESLKELIKSIEEAQSSGHELAVLDGAEWEDEVSVTTFSV